MHYLIDVSGHGYGHLVIVAPILQAMAARSPGLRLTLRSALPETQLRRRIGLPFEYLAGGSDIGCLMQHAREVDWPATAAAYRAEAADWAARLAAECDSLRRLCIDRVLTSVAYLPLAAAARLGLPAAAVCSLNWADIVRHGLAGSPDMAAIHARLHGAYAGATDFFCLTPGMPMSDLPNRRPVGLVARGGRRQRLLPEGEKGVLIGLGGVPHALPVGQWPQLPGVRWIVPDAWAAGQPHLVPQGQFGLSYDDLIASADALVCKPGYGTFAEAAVSGTPLLYVDRPDWPEAAYLVAWFKQHGRAREIAPAALESGDLGEALAALWAMPAPPPPVADGAAAIAAALLG